MTRVGTAKLVLAVLGIGAFLWGAGHARSWARWTGVGLVSAAWLLRFIERGHRHPAR